MKNLELIGIVAISDNNVIGNGNFLPWYIPEDLKQFKERTKSHVVLMGRKTYESIGKLLPNRQNVIITRQEDFNIDNAIVIHNPDEIYNLDLISDKVFIIGGKEVFDLYFQKIKTWYISHIKKNVDGDVYFKVNWDLISEKQELLYSDDDFEIIKYIIK